MSDMERIAAALEAMVKQNKEALGLLRENVSVSLAIEEYWRRRDKRDELEDISRMSRQAVEQKAIIETLRTMGYTVERKPDD